MSEDLRLTPEDKAVLKAYSETDWDKKEGLSEKELIDKVLFIFTMLEGISTPDQRRVLECCLALKG